MPRRARQPSHSQSCVSKYVGPGGETKKSPGDADPKTGKVTSDADILKLQGEGGEADPLGPINKGGGGN